ncbi:MAG TPA: carbon-nitrogen hydrolase family protein [Candidatus Izemoplasmatales bacterium]|nr:carbon-nitrogen hydrolase family protein [Candidatus Izemoplasmatales bacterium]
MKVLVIQNDVQETVEKNLRHMDTLMSKIPKDSFDFILFPEMFTSPYEHHYFKLNSQTSDGQVIQYLKKIAKQYHSYVIGGSVPEKDGDKIYNSAFVFNPQGHVINKYQKIHLFSITYPNGVTFKESDLLSSGNQLSIIETPYGKVGIIICFDIRFPELIKKYREAGCQCLFVPAAFNTYTGPLHWRTTFRARAIDNQIYMIGSSPSRQSFGSYEPYGHSLVVDPFGKVIKELDDKEGYIIVDVDLSRVNDARQRIPIIKNEVNLSDMLINHEVDQ